MSRFAVLCGRVLAAIAALALLSAGVSAKEPVRAEAPALWKIQGAKSNVYLLGSIHVLPPQANWRSPAIERALKEAEVVVFEVDMVEEQNPQVIQPLMLKYGLLPRGEGLRGILPKEVYADLERVGAGLGMPMQQLEPMRPWMVALMLAVHSILKEGYAVESGVDNQVDVWARANGRQIGALETAESQLQIFANLTREQEIEFLKMTLAQQRNAKQMMAEMTGAYLKGDTALLEKHLVSGMNDFPMLRNKLLNSRHDQWLPTIEKMMSSGRTHVVVVGVGHLVGADSVVAMLRARGVKVEGP